MRGGLVFDLRRHAVHDGPGIRSAVFLKGCPLRCAWCHNPEGLSPRPEILAWPDRCIGCGHCARACPLGLEPWPARRPTDGAAAGSPAAGSGEPYGAAGPPSPAGGPACAACPDFGACARACPAEALRVAGRRVSAEALFEELAADRCFYEESGGGVTFTGGEPLAQPGFLAALLDACGAAGIHAAVDSSGHAPPAAMADIASRADLVLYDLKLVDPGRHRAATGVDNSLILANLRALARARRDALAGEGPPSAALAIRLPLVPGINDLPGDLEAVAGLLAALPLHPGDSRPVHLLPFHDSARGKYRLRGIPWPLEGTEPPSAERVAAAAELLSSRGLDARVGGS